MKKLLALMCAVVLAVNVIPTQNFYLLHATTTQAADIVEKNPVVVSATDDEINIKISNLGTSGTARVIQMNADEYLKKDAIKGLSESTEAEGEVVGEYTCKSDAVITLKRYTKQGVDNLYSKFYVVQNDNILYGPVYANNITPQKATKTTYKVSSKKGLFDEDYASAIDLGANSTVININLPQIIIANEDKNGNPIDCKEETIDFVSNGTLYKFRSSVVHEYDAKIRQYSNAGINVTLIMLAMRNSINEVKTYPYALQYGDVSGSNRKDSICGFNTSNQLGRGYWIACMEFLADRYSNSAKKGLVHNYVIGNELDYAFSYNVVSSAGKVPLDVYMEEISREMRLAALATAKYADDIEVSVPFTHMWAQTGYDYIRDAYGAASAMQNTQNNTYAPKEMIDWLAEKSNAQGDYPWGIAPHCYGDSTAQSNVSLFDSIHASEQAPSSLKYTSAMKMSGDYHNSSMLTFSNLEILQNYLEQDALKYNGRVRSVYLTESGVSSFENKEQNFSEQGQHIASSWYKVANLDCIKEYNYYRLYDHKAEADAQMCTGLIDVNNQKKAVYQLWKFIDTQYSFALAEPYLKSVNFWKNSKSSSQVSYYDGITYRDIMAVWDSEFNWNDDKNWDMSKMTPVTTEQTPYTGDEKPELKAPSAIKYVLEDDTDGFANGSVVISLPVNNTATDIVMYWADANGKPLEGYTSMAKVKVMGSVVKTKMTENTIIPKGAKKLIAYASDGTNLTKEYAQTDLPQNCSYEFQKNYKEFQMVSDIHITTEEVEKNSTNYDEKYNNEHFRQLMADIVTNSPDSFGLFVNGDLADTGNEYDVLEQLLSTQPGLPQFYGGIGNHDLYKARHTRDDFANYTKRAQKFIDFINKVTGMENDKVYYDTWVEGYHFIVLGSEAITSNGCDAVLSATQLKWLDELLQKDTEKYPNQPVFLMMHQGIYDTVAGTLPGQGWHGIVEQQKFIDVIKKYSQVILFSGHSHWELNSEMAMYPGTTELPITIYDTGAVGYLWSTYEDKNGAYIPGTQGYFARIYDDGTIAMLGRDFEHQQFIPSAMFLRIPQTLEIEQTEYDVIQGCDPFKLSVTSSAEDISYTSSDSNVVYVDSTGRVVIRGAGEAVINVVAEASSTKTATGKTVKIKVSPCTHVYQKKVVAPTCTKKGFTKYTCRKCGDEYIDEKSYVNATGHVYVKKEVAPTCTEKGYTEYTCRNCGESYIDDKSYVNPRGHSYDTSELIIIPATTAKAGEISKICSLCNEKVVVTAIPKIASITLNQSKYIYSGKANVPKVTVKDEKGNKIDPKFYTVTYANNVNVGIARVTVTFSVNYSGKINKTFAINPKKTTLKKLQSKKKKQLTIKWKKINVQVTGYQISYALNKKFKKAKTVTVKKYKTISKTVRKLKSKKLYYVRIRTYKNVDGKTYYSAWSKTKSKKVK